MSDFSGVGKRRAEGETAHRVTFFRQILSSNGAPHDVVLEIVHIGENCNRVEAEKQAIEQFKRRWGLNEWQSLAHRFEYEIAADRPVARTRRTSPAGGLARTEKIKERRGR